jgi:diaminopimelate decarboxylase
MSRYAQPNLASWDRMRPTGHDPVPYADITRQYGTPVYIYQPQVLAEDISDFRGAAKQSFDTFDMLFSLKTNYLPAVLDDIMRAGLGIDVVSGYEFEVARRSGFEGARIVVNGPYKPIELLREAVRHEAFVNIETMEEIPVLSTLSRKMAQPLSVGVRFTSAIDPYTGEPRQLPSKFGALPDSEYAAALLDAIEASPELNLVGIHSHLGSQILASEHYFAALSPVLEMTGRLRDRFPLDRVNVGGGIGVAGISRVRMGSSNPSRPSPGQAEFTFTGANLTEWFGEMKYHWRLHGLDDLRLVTEPGRAVVSRAMQLLTRVASVRSTAGQTTVTLDGGVNLLPTAGPGEAHHMTFPGLDGPNHPVRIVGPLCFEGDVFSYAVPAPEVLEAGHVVVIEDAGAYALTRATSFNQLRAPVVRHRNGMSELVWRRETVDDVLSFARIDDTRG